MKLGFVFTNYNNSHFTAAAVNSILGCSSSHECSIVVVDNNSNVDDVQSLHKVQRDHPSVHVIFNDTNVGYFRGLNIGIEHLRRECPELRFLVVGNNDLVFPENFMERMISNEATLCEYPVVAPDLLTLDGVHQNPHVVSEISGLRKFVWDLYYSNYGVSLAISAIARFCRRFAERTDYQQHMVPQTISEGYGACYILTPKFFEHFDCLWAPTFLMGEEFFLRLQLQSKGLRVYYDPSILVNHHDHATIGKVGSKKLWQIARESHGVYKKYADDLSASTAEIQRSCWKS